MQVEDAQAREAPVQRIADAIAGPFVYTVMTLAAATFSFWYFSLTICSFLTSSTILPYLFLLVLLFLPFVLFSLAQHYHHELCLEPN
jgi:cation transport ATPase